MPFSSITSSAHKQDLNSYRFLFPLIPLCCPVEQQIHSPAAELFKYNTKGLYYKKKINFNLKK